MKNIELEAALERVRGLPRYSTEEVRAEYGDDPAVMWIAEYELEAALQSGEEGKSMSDRHNSQSLTGIYVRPSEVFDPNGVAWKDRAIKAEDRRRPK